MKHHLKKHLPTRMWVVAIGSLWFEMRWVKYGARRRAEQEAENLFYEAYWDDENLERQVRLFSGALALTPRIATFAEVGQLDLSQLLLDTYLLRIRLHDSYPLNRVILTH